MNRLKPVYPALALITALLFVSVHSAFLLLPPPAQAQKGPLKSIRYEPSLLPQLSMSYEDHSFKIQFHSYFIRVRPFVIFQGKYYGLQQILSFLHSQYPQVTYASILQRFKRSIHYGFNLSRLPQKVADGLEYVGFRVVDVNFPLSWLRLEHRKGGFPLLRLSRANLILSFEDLYPYGYSVRAVNSSYILIGGVTGRTSLFLDPIVKSGDTMIITGGTEEAEIENVYWEFWNASYVNAWDLAFRNQFGVQFAFNCTLQIGDGETETWVADEEVQVLFFSDNDPIYITNYAHLRLGKLLDPSTKTVSRGCTLYFNLTFYRSILGDSESDVRFYDTKFHAIQGGIGDKLETWLDGNQIYYGCTFINFYAVSASASGTSAWHDVRVVENGGLYLEEADLDFEKVWALNTTHFARLDLYEGDITIREFYGRNSQGDPFYLAVYENYLYLINPDLDSWGMVIIAGSGEVYRQYTFDLSFTFQNGSYAEGTNVTISNDYLGTSDSWILSSNGSIPQQTYSMGHYNQTGGDVLYDYNPYRITASLEGYQTYSQIFNITEQTAWRVALLEEIPVAETPPSGPFFQSYQIDYGAAIGIRAPRRVEPSLTQYLSNRLSIAVDLVAFNRLWRRRNLELRYNVTGPGGELILEGTMERELDPNSQEELTLNWEVPLRKKEAPKNYTLSIMVLSRDRLLGDPVSYVITVGQSSWAPLYVLGLLGVVCVVAGICYGGYRLFRREGS